MKKACFVGICLGICGLAQAVTINAPSSLTGYQVLNGANAYSWGIPISLTTGQTINSATISFSSVTLNVAGSSGHGYLYTDLLNLNSGGVKSYYDGDAPGDYFASAYPASTVTSVGAKYFASAGTTLSWDYILNASQLTVLNSYVTNGLFDLGFDPDCHFSVGGITFSYTTITAHTQVPDGATTALLLGTSLLGLAFVRRKLAANR